MVRRGDDGKPQESVARWRGADGAGLEHCRVLSGAEGTAIEALVISAEGFAARYRIGCDAGWRVRTAEIELLDGRAPRVLRSDGAGHWAGDGGDLAILDGAIDIDISATPFTNTLPIRRLGLRVGDTAEITVAYLDMPTLALSRRPQRYSRLAERLWRFETLDMDFAADITVDGDGLVLAYPGLFTREPSPR